MSLLSLRRSPVVASQRPGSPSGQAGLAFDVVYDENLRYVWRAARRLGIEASDTDDVVQEVFFVAHRRLPDFEGRASIKTWLFKILMFVIRHHRRARKRRLDHSAADSGRDLERLADHHGRGPAEAAERADAVRILDGLLRQLDSEKREVFVLAEIEQLSSVEIADVLDVNVNTVYSRLRVARQEFERALTRFQQREMGRQP
jgi:RNA polymerase sigma-70 factor (ECF subfamily)